MSAHLHLHTKEPFLESHAGEQFSVHLSLSFALHTFTVWGETGPLGHLLLVVCSVAKHALMVVVTRSTTFHALQRPLFGPVTDSSSLVLWLLGRKSSTPSGITVQSGCVQSLGGQDDPINTAADVRLGLEPVHFWV